MTKRTAYATPFKADSEAEERFKQAMKNFAESVRRDANKPQIYDNCCPHCWMHQPFGATL